MLEAISVAIIVLLQQVKYKALCMAAPIEYKQQERRRATKRPTDQQTDRQTSIIFKIFGLMQFMSVIVHFAVPSFL